MPLPVVTTLGVSRRFPCPAPPRQLRRHGMDPRDLRRSLSLALRPEDDDQAGWLSAVSLVHRSAMGRNAGTRLQRRNRQSRASAIGRKPNAFVILGQSRSEANCEDPGIHAVNYQLPPRSKTGMRLRPMCEPSEAKGSLEPRGRLRPGWCGGHERGLEAAAPPFAATQMTWRAPPPLVLARTLTSSTTKPLSCSRRVKARSGPCDHTVSTPPGFSAARAACRPAWL